MARFVLVAGGSLLLEDREVLGFTHDLSMHGVGLLLEGETPALGTRGGLEVRDALGVLLPRTERARRAHERDTAAGRGARRPRFDDPQRVAGATGRLLALLGLRRRLAQAARPALRAPRTLARSSSGARIVKSQSSPASTPAIQSSEPTRMRSSVRSPVCASSASVGGRRRGGLVDRQVEQHLDLPRATARARATG